jgi:HEPN domain-containing protein
MSSNDFVEWIIIANDDLESAKYLTSMYPQPVEIICYLCSQSAEKYLKGFLASNNIVAPKTHSLVLLRKLCIDIDNVNFHKIFKECKILTAYATETRYPLRIQVNEADMKYALKAVENIKKIEPIKKLIDYINQDIATRKE